MFPKPRADLAPNTADFERLPLVKPTGFREYDARWLFPQDINLMGLEAIGLGLATLAGRRGVPKRFVVGHDYRSYSGQVKQALMSGLLAGGAQVHDIGLALSPMAYFSNSYTNPYFTADDASLPEDHPRRTFMERSSGFVTRDQIPPTSPIHRLDLPGYGIVSGR